MSGKGGGRQWAIGYWREGEGEGIRVSRARCARSRKISKTGKLYSTVWLPSAHVQQTKCTEQTY